MMSAGLAFESTADARAGAGLVGPNAVIQLGAALREASGAVGAAERVFASAGFLRLLHSPPDAMIDEAVPARLFEALWRELPSDAAASIAYAAGRRTGEYVLTNRIPSAARVLLRALPPHIAALLLLKAIRKNAWTFAGSGTCRVTAGSPSVLTIENNPLATPGCVWHVGVLECLFRALVSQTTQVSHSRCQSDGGSLCRFEIDLGVGSKGRKAQSS